MWPARKGRAGRLNSPTPIRPVACRAKSSHGPAWPMPATFCAVIGQIHSYSAIANRCVYQMSPSEELSQIIRPWRTHPLICGGAEARTLRRAVCVCAVSEAQVPVAPSISAHGHSRSTSRLRSAPLPGFPLSSSLPFRSSLSLSLSLSLPSSPSLPCRSLCSAPLCVPARGQRPKESPQGAPRNGGDGDTQSCREANCMNFPCVFHRVLVLS
jgi:hypothetical protein